MNIVESKEEHPREYGEVKGHAVSKLRELGLSSYAARAFLSVLEKQPISATAICNETGIPDSKVYYALKELEDRKLVMVQHGTPSTYRISSSRQLLSGLESDIERDYRRKIESARELEKSLEPLIIKSTSRDSEVELAYIVKGFRTIAGKMKEFVSEARKEIVFMATDKNLLRDLESALLDAKNQGNIRVKIAISQKLKESEGFKTRIKSNKALLCECNLLIVDSERLISAELGDPEHQYAMVTRNQGMITLTRKSYDNPSCCC